MGCLLCLGREVRLALAYPCRKARAGTTLPPARSGDIPEYSRRRRGCNAASDVGEHALQCARYAAKLERLHERRCESDLPVREEAPKLFLGRPCSVRWLLLVGAKRSQLPIRGEDLLYDLGAKTADQLVLQIPIAHEEAKSLHPSAVEVLTEASALEGATERSLLPRVTEPGQPDIRSGRTVEIQESADRLRSPDGQYGNALGRKISATANRERLQRNLVAHALNKHNRTQELHPGILTLERKAIVTRPRLRNLRAVGYHP